MDIHLKSIDSILQSVPDELDELPQHQRLMQNQKLSMPKANKAY